MQQSDATKLIKQRYGQAAQFMITFNKQIQPKTAENAERAYLGTAPTLRSVKEAYSPDVLVTWLMAQLEDMNDFINVNQKLNLEQMEETARIIGSEYYYLKVTEIHLFLYRLKIGRYGLFYGSIDPLRIMVCLNSFLEERRNEINVLERKYVQEKLNKLRDEWSRTAISRKEYEQLKAKNHETGK